MNINNSGSYKYFEIGPGQVLKNLNYQISPNLLTDNYENIEHLDQYEILRSN